MRPHISLDVQDVRRSAEFYEKVFGVKPQKLTADYAKFDLAAPALNLSLLSTTRRISSVNHFGVEVASVEEIATWKKRLQTEKVIERVEENVACCFARQDKLWLSDPDGNAWEIFTVHEQLDVTGAVSNTGCCIPTRQSSNTANPACLCFGHGMIRAGRAIKAAGCSTGIPDHHAVR